MCFLDGCFDGVGHDFDAAQEARCKSKPTVERSITKF